MFTSRLRATPRAGLAAFARLVGRGLAALVLLAATASAQDTNRAFVPEVGQAGKDVVWVPTPPELVEKMLDLAKVTPSDFVVDLGSGDGRNVIGAARRGARALGVEFNQDMVDLSRRNAAAAGVADLARFEQGDMFKADFSQATVLALFLLPSNMLQLRSKFLLLAPGSRIVSNTFRIEGWEPDATDSVGGGCEAWCEALLWIVPARVEGRWRLSEGQLALTQQYQKVSGTLTVGTTTTAVSGTLTGTTLVLSSSDRQWRGEVRGDRIDLASTGQAAVSAVRIGS